MAKDTNLTMFLTGLGIGAVGAILLAPAAGRETREKVMSAANGASDRIKETWAKGGDLVDGLQGKVNDAVASAGTASRKAMDDVVEESRDFTHSAGKEVEAAGQRLQQV